jgi:beta-lactamase superfamily II metal-dependent hydrolase
MYEVDFLPVGQGGRHGDAIAIRLTRPDTGGYAHVVIDAGFEENGEALVEHVQRYFGTRSIDIAVVTHPDGDHIGGMGRVIRDLDVGVLCIHKLGQRGGGSLPAAEAVDELVELAESRGTAVHEPFAGSHAFDGAFRILGPTPDYYEALVAAQIEEAEQRARPSALREAARLFGQRLLAALPIEVPFDDAGGTNPRNNSSAITLISVDGHRMVFPADAGVPALDRALDWANASAIDTAGAPFIQMAHHGSRHNASSPLLDRLLGPIGTEQTRPAFVNVGPDAKKHPSPRVANVFMRRGYRVYQTGGQTIHHFSADAPDRPGWTPLTPMAPLDESTEDG